MFDPSQVALMIQRHKGDGRTASDRRLDVSSRLVYGSLPVVGSAGLKLSREAQRKIQNKSALCCLDLGEEIFQSAHLHVNIVLLAQPEAPRC